MYCAKCNKIYPTGIYCLECGSHLVNPPASTPPAFPVHAPVAPHFATPKRKLGVGAILGIVGGALTLISVAAVAILMVANTARINSIKDSKLVDAAVACPHSTWGDVASSPDVTYTKRYMSLDGYDSSSGNLYLDEIVCVLRNLGAPGSIRDEMVGTYTADGRQFMSWDDVDVSWIWTIPTGYDVEITINDSTDGY